MDYEDGVARITYAPKVPFHFHRRDLQPQLCYSRQLFESQTSILMPAEAVFGWWNQITFYLY